MIGEKHELKVEGDFRQLRVKNLTKVNTGRLERYSNPQPFGQKNAESTCTNEPPPLHLQPLCYFPLDTFHSQQKTRAHEAVLNCESTPVPRHAHHHHRLQLQLSSGFTCINPSLAA